MKLHDKMAADQLWVRSHSHYDQFNIYQTQGQHFPIHFAPNFEERIEMSYRTIGRNYDWDLEKFRLSRKHSDKGGRRRLLKNISKFIKHPAGYIYWRTHKLFQHSRWMVIGYVLGVAVLFKKLIDDTISVEQINNWKQVRGETLKKSVLQMDKQREVKAGLPPNPLWHLLYNRIDPNNIVVNPTYKQNYRLYFDRQDFKA